MELTLKNHLTLSERTARIVEKAILSASIKPGERLIETELAKNLGISKSPVREALKRLEGDGIVQLVPRKGYFVRDIDQKSIEDFFDVMFILEPTAAVLSLEKKSETVCREIDEILDNYLSNKSDQIIGTNASNKHLLSNKDLKSLGLGRIINIHKLVIITKPTRK